MSEVGLLAAVVAGLLNLLSPCSALVLPSFFAYAFTSPAALVRRTMAFYLGLAATLVPLGVGAGTASRLVYGHRGQLIAVAGWTIIGIGVLLVLGRSFQVPLAGRLQSWAATRTTRRAGWLGTVLLGATYGLAGFCSGPILGAILTIAATSGTPAYGALLLAAYALGMTLPLFVLALLWDRLHLGDRSVVRGRMWRLGPLQVHSSRALAGGLFITIGALFLAFDGTAGLLGTLGLPDTTDLEFSLQNRLQPMLAAIPVWVVPAALTVAVAAWALRTA